jgi:hypothetical protein
VTYAILFTPLELSVTHSRYSELGRPKETKDVRGSRQSDSSAGVTTLGTESSYADRLEIMRMLPLSMHAVLVKICFDPQSVGTIAGSTATALQKSPVGHYTSRAAARDHLFLHTAYQYAVIVWKIP